MLEKEEFVCPICGNNEYYNAGSFELGSDPYACTSCSVVFMNPKSFSKSRKDLGIRKAEAGRNARRI